MDTIHDQLAQNSKGYKNWHKNGYHHAVHWIIFGLIVALVGLFLWTQITDWKDSLSAPQAGLKALSPSAVLSLDPQTETVKKGDTFAVNIILDTGNGPTDGVDVYALHYDPTVLTVIDDASNQTGTQIEPGKIISINAANAVDKSTGTIKFGQVTSGGSTYIGKGILATIHFKAISAGKTYLKFDFSPGSTKDTNVAHNGRDQLVRVVDGTYTVTK